MRNFNALVPGIRLIGIDPAPRETGIAVVDLVGKTFSVPYSRSFKTDPSVDIDRRLGNLIADIAEEVDRHAGTENVITLEGYIPQPRRNPQPFELLLTRLSQRFFRDNRNFMYRSAPSIKKFIARDPRASKVIVANVVRINTDVVTDNHHITDAVATALYGGYMIGVISPTDELRLVRYSGTIPEPNDNLIPPGDVSTVAVDPDATLKQEGHQTQFRMRS